MMLSTMLKSTLNFINKKAPVSQISFVASVNEMRDLGNLHPDILIIAISSTHNYP